MGRRGYPAEFRRRVVDLVEACTCSGDLGLEGAMEVRYCPNCGEPRWPGAMFCGACGLAYETLDVGADPNVAESEALTAGAAASTAAASIAAPPLSGLEAPPAFTPYRPTASPWGSESDPAPSADTATWRDQPLADSWTGTDFAPWEAERPSVVPGYATLTFSVAGLVLAVAGALLVALAVPHAGSGFASLVGAGDRGGDLVPLLVAVVAAIVAVVGAGLFAARALPLAPAVAILLLAAIGVEAPTVAILGRIAWDTAGGVLPGPSLLIAGGAALISAAVAGVLIHG